MLFEEREVSEQRTELVSIPLRLELPPSVLELGAGDGFVFEEAGLRNPLVLSTEEDEVPGSGIIAALLGIDPGDDGTLDDIVRNTERGIILDGDKSWSIGSNREQFHFATDIGWLVEDGQVTRVVKNSTYQGETVPFYNSLSAVGDRSTWEVCYVANCGKGQPNQIMQLGHGVPVCRFDHVRIGE